MLLYVFNDGFFDVTHFHLLLRNSIYIVLNVVSGHMRRLTVRMTRGSILGSDTKNVLLALTAGVRKARKVLAPEVK